MPVSWLYRYFVYLSPLSELGLTIVIGELYKYANSDEEIQVLTGLMATHLLSFVPLMLLRSDVQEYIKLT